MSEEEDAPGSGFPPADGEEVTVLVVDDEPEVLDLVDDSLRAVSEFPIEVLTTTEPADAAELVAEGAIDCVVSDYEMPGTDGFGLLHRVEETAPDLPFILLTGRGSEEIASRAITEGVTDYLQKDFSAEQFELLANRIENAVTHSRTVEQRNWRETLLSDIANNISESVFVTGEDYELLYVNDVIEDLYGIPKSTLQENPMAFLEEIHDEDRDRVDEWIAEMEADAATGDVEDAYEVEYRIEHPDRGSRWINTTVYPIADGDDDFSRMVGVASDVTERRAVLETVRRSEEKFRGIAETSNDVIFRVDVAGTVTYASPALGRVLGYDPVAVEGEAFIDYVSVDHSETALEKFAEAMDGESQNGIVITLRDADGHSVPVEVSASPIRQDGEVVGVQGVARDISDRLERERELEQYETIVETVPDGVFVLDPDGRVVSGNDWAASMIGLDDRDADFPSDPLPEMADHWISTEEAIEKYTDAVAELLSGDRERTMFRLSTPVDGERRTFEVHIALRPTEDGEFRGTTGVIRDITDRQRYERELERQNERLQEFANTLSHDLRNPLNVAQARVKMAIRTGDTERLSSAADALDRTSDLIDDILTLARQSGTALEARPVSIETTARRAWETVETGDADLTVEDAPGGLVADESRLRRLFENLFRNAVEHAGEEVSVTVGALPEAAGFVVSDDGPGIRPAEREKVFEQGYSTAGSTGFGLPIVADIVEAHGWKVDLTESPDGGVRFEVRVGDRSEDEPTRSTRPDVDFVDG